jgi:large subunit ribosomal protein L28
MSKLCKITGKKPLVGNNVSKSLNRTKRRQFPNLQTKRIFIPELGKKVKIKLTANAIKTIDKYGLIPYLKKQGKVLSDIL